MTQTSKNPSHRIALIHALAESIEPARRCFAQSWPEATVFDLLDTSLATDLVHSKQLTNDIVERFKTLGRYARNTSGVGGETRGILFTCSAFGPAIEAVKREMDVPTLRPNESAFREALDGGQRIAIVVSFSPSLDPLITELEQQARLSDKAVSVTGAIADGALAALKAGDGEQHDRLIAEAASRLSGIDTLILGQFSLARSQNLVRTATPARVISTPDAAVNALKKLIA